MKKLLTTIILLWAYPAMGSGFHLTTGPAQATLEYDRYSGQGSFTLIYDGYLHDCSQWLGTVTALLIFHRGETTEIVERPMHRLCEGWSFLYEDVAFYRSFKSQRVEDQQLWFLLEQASIGYADFELAFVRGDDWDSDYSHNYPVSPRQ